MKIISTVPSITELLSDLNLETEVIGITKFCVHPPDWRKTKSIIGGTKNLNLDRIKNLHPDLIIANKEENTKKQIQELEQHFEVMVTDIKDLSDNLSLIEQIALRCDRQKESEILKQQFVEAAEKIKQQHFTEGLYLIWKDPLMTVGCDTYIHSMMHHMGIHNVMSESSRYPEISQEAIFRLKPKVILLSSEPYPFKTSHIQWFQNEFPFAKCILVDGELFSWYGSRLIHCQDQALDIISLMK